MNLRLIKKINFVVDCLTALTFIVITLGVIIAVTGRYVFKYPAPSAMDAAYFGMLYCAFLQTGKALFENKHVNMPFFIDRLPLKATSIFDILVNLIILFVSFFMIWHATKFTKEAYVMKWYSSGSLAFPMFCLYGVMALGILYLAFIAVFKIIESIRLMNKGT